MEGEAEVALPPPMRSDVSPLQPEGTADADAARFTPPAKECAAVTGASAGACADVEMEEAAASSPPPSTKLGEATADSEAAGEAASAEKANPVPGEESPPQG